MADNNYIVVGTKVRKETSEQLKKICAKKGIVLYDMLQMMCDCMVRYMSDQHNLTPDLERVMSIFEHMDGWKDAFNLVDPSASPMVSEATYYIGDETKKGVRAVHVERPFMGMWTQEFNIQKILEKSLCLMFPERYKRMRLVALNMGCSSLLEMIDTLIDEYGKDEDVKAFREDFEDADRSDYGRKPTDSPYKRKLHRTVESFEQSQQKVITFGEEDKELSDLEADFRPHGYEH